MKVIVTEKPSVARDIAAFLKASSKREGYFEGNGYQVTWAFGHLVSLKEPEDYDPNLKRWAVAQLPIIPSQFELKVIESSSVKKQFSVIKRLLLNAEEVIEATDAGREGELIFRYILSLCRCTKPMSRLWLNSLTEEALGKAFNHLKPLSHFDNLYHAARCRSESDWIVGLNATRFLTVKYGFGQLLWSVGRVQTPVLALIAKKDALIRHFKPEPFWELLTVYRGIHFKFKGERFKKKEEGEALLATVLGKPLTIEKMESKEEKVLPPQLYDLTELQRDMNRRFGMSAQDTLDMAQLLYENKAITYPRTDSRYLSQDMKDEVKHIFKQLLPFRSEVGELDLASLPFSSRIINDKKVSDHHAIIPTGKRRGEWPNPALKVYEAIVTRLIAAFYPPCLKKVTLVEAQVERVAFRAKGVIVAQAGWTALYPKQKEGEGDIELPLFTVHESGAQEPYLKEGKTEPPKHYSENSLLGAMETAGKLVDDDQLKDALKEKGLGTPATRALIIETLLKRGYIARDKKLLKVTAMGRFLMALIQNPLLKSAELTGEWEAKLKMIEEGSFSREDFMREIASYTQGFIDQAAKAELNYQSWGTCPCCQAPIIEGKVGYGCSRWREGCSFRLWREWKGEMLSPQDIRQLTQQRVLLRKLTVEGSEPAILALSDEGEVIDLTLPKRAPFVKKGKRAVTK